MIIFFGVYVCLFSHLEPHHRVLNLNESKQAHKAHPTHENEWNPPHVCQIKRKTPQSSWISEPGTSAGSSRPKAARWWPWWGSFFFFFFWCEPTKICLFLSDHYDRVMGYKRGRKKTEKKIILAIFSFFQDNLCFLGGDDRKWVSHWNVYLPLLFLLLLRPWYSHCLKGTFCVDLFDEKWFCFVNYVVNFIGFCIILFFVENWVWCYLFSIWSGNVTLFDGQVVCACVCAHVFACVGAWACIQWVFRRAGDMRRQSDREREKAVVSLLLFLSLAFSPSCGTGFESECIVKQNWLFFFFYAWQAELSVGCFEPNFQKTPQNRFFPRRSLKNLSESAMFRNRFHLRTKRVFCFQNLVKRLCVFFFSFS